jgi:ABC-2 type transport system ATP-binding protein
MTIAEVFEFCAGIFPAWDDEFRRSLASELALPDKRLVKQLSRGELAKLNLIVAMAHRPELLILDEPTTGLDPLVRAQFLESVATMAKQQGMTVLFSTHILSDIDQIAERLLVLFAGRLVANDSIEQLQKRYTKVSILFDEPPAVQREVPHALRVKRGLREWVAIFPAAVDVSNDFLRSTLGAVSATTHRLTTEDIFEELLHPASNVA